MGQSQGKISDTQLESICKEKDIQDVKKLKDQISFLRKKDYEVTRFLGKGVFGVVVEAHDKHHKHVVIKIISNQAQSNLKEVLVLEKIKNQKHLIEIKEYLINLTLNTLFIICEHYDCSLRQFLNNNDFSQRQVYALTSHLLQGLLELKKFEIFHLDIKPENVLYSRHKNAFMYCKLIIKQINQRYSQYYSILQIADFGLSQFLKNPLQDQKSDNFQGGISINYAAPEQLVEAQKNKLSHKIDVYSLGLTISEIINGQSFQISQIKDIQEKDNLKSYLQQNSQFQDFINEILMNMVRVQQDDRLEPADLLEILNHEFSFNDQDLLELSIPKQIRKQSSLSYSRSLSDYQDNQENQENQEMSQNKNEGNDQNLLSIKNQFQYKNSNLNGGYDEDHLNVQEKAIQLYNNQQLEESLKLFQISSLLAKKDERSNLKDIFQNKLFLASIYDKLEKRKQSFEELKSANEVLARLNINQCQIIGKQNLVHQNIIVSHPKYFLHFTLGNLYKEENDLINANTFLKEAFMDLKNELTQNKQGENKYHDTEIALNSFAQELLLNKNYKQSIYVYSDLLMIQLLFLGENHTKVSQTLQYIGNALLQSNQYQSAIENFNQAIKIYDELNLQDESQFLKKSIENILKPSPY